MRRFFCAALEGLDGEVVLEESVSHHLLRVSGIAPGEEVELFDGRGGAVRAALARVEAGRAVVRLLGPLVIKAEGSPVYLLPALLKRAAFERVLRMGTELGVTHIWPVVAQRSIQRGDKKERWERLVQSAAAQSGLARIPQLAQPRVLTDALAAVPAGVARYVLVPGAAAVRPQDGAVAILVGPEGGWGPGEVSQALESGFLPVGLGDSTLRADTAGVAALARLTGPR